MKSEKLIATKARLDAKLADRVDYTHIALGFDLYSAFWAYGYIKHQEFEVLGKPGLILSVLTYGTRGYVFPDPDIFGDDFRLADSASAVKVPLSLSRTDALRDSGSQSSPLSSSPSQQNPVAASTLSRSARSARPRT